MNYSSSLDTFTTFNGNGGFEIYLSNDTTNAKSMLEERFAEEGML